MVRSGALAAVAFAALSLWWPYGSPTGIAEHFTAARASLEAASSLQAGTESEVSFTSGPDTIYGTLEVPLAAAGSVPGAIILAGSGPTDRDGNSRSLPGPTDTLRNFAHALAADGVASLRYDKLGSGTTGAASHMASSTDINFDTFVDEALAAYQYLAGRPEIDAAHMLILGHSEGGLIALVLATRLANTTAPPQALVLASPLPMRYLDLLRRQEAALAGEQVQSGRASQDQADAFVAELDRVIASLRAIGALPPDGVHDRSVAALFTPINAAFLAQADRYDPADLAASLTPALPVLVLHGEKDSQIATVEVQRLMDGFTRAGNQQAQAHELADVDHVFKEVPGEPNPAEDYINPALAFSQEAVALLSTFLAGAFRAQSPGAE